MIPDLPSPPALKPGVIQVWQSDLAAWRDSSEHLAGLLSPTEKKRLERLKIKAKRIEFILSRGLLRLVLGSYLGQDPGKLEIQVSQGGKPFLANQQVSFNISHSGDVLLCACGLNLKIGIDVQEVYEISSLETIIKRNFSSLESKYLEGLDSPQQAFFEIWTAKEAYLKAVGAGFQGDPTEISLLPDPSRPGRFIVPEISGNSQHWSVIPLEVRIGFKAALAAEGEIRNVQIIPLLPPGIAG